MKKILVFLALIPLLMVVETTWAYRSHHAGYGVNVRSYMKRNGTYVHGYHRSMPHRRY